jgi:hypothetical protein
MQLIADRLSELLVHRGCDGTTAVLAGQIALACYPTAKRPGQQPPQPWPPTPRTPSGERLPSGPVPPNPIIPPPWHDDEAQ